MKLVAAMVGTALPNQPEQLVPVEKIGELLSVSTDWVYDRAAAGEGLRDTWVRLDEGSVFVDAEAYRGRLAPTKTRKGRRRIYLSGLAGEVLAEQLRLRVTSELGLVFPSPSGVIWRADNFRNRVFYPARRRARFERLTFHDLRHTCASLMIAAGANPLEVAEQLGHIDAQLVFKRYGHLYPGASRQAVLRLDSITGPALDVGQMLGSAVRR